MKFTDENGKPWAGERHNDAGYLVFPIKPKPKPIDLSCLEGSDVIMEFGDVELGWFPGLLTEVHHNYGYYLSGWDNFEQIRFTNKWAVNPGHNVWPEGVIVMVTEYHFSNIDSRIEPALKTGAASLFDWDDTLISHSRYHSLVEGWCMPGEESE